MKNLRITYNGPIGGDCCSHKTYEPIEPMTVQELCDEILKDTREWGYIGIREPGTRGTTFGDPHVEYSHGQYEGGQDFKFPPQIANAHIKKVDWDGGWSRGD